MKIITVANQKGGVGKSTLCTNLAVMFATEGSKTLLVDTDPQASSIAFRQKREESASDLPQFSASQILLPTIHKDVPTFTNFDIIIIDTGGRDNKVFRSAVLPANLALVPLCPSQYDFWGSADTFDACRDIRLQRPDLKVLSCFNMVIPNTKITQEVLASRDDLEKGYEVKFMDSLLCARVAWKYSAAQGRGVIEMNGRDRDPKAIDEFRAFFSELKEVLHG